MFSGILEKELEQGEKLEASLFTMLILLISTLRESTASNFILQIQ